MRWPSWNTPLNEWEAQVLIPYEDQLKGQNLLIIGAALKNTNANTYKIKYP